MRALKIKKILCRGLSLVLTGALLLSPNSALLERAWAAENDVLALAFTEGKPLIAEIIRGQRIGIRASNTQNYGIKTGEDALLIYKAGNNELIESGFTVIPPDKYDENSNKDDYQLVAEKNIVGGKVTDTKTDSYKINANYRAMKKEARTVLKESDGEGINAGGTLKLAGDSANTRIGVDATSKATLTYDGTNLMFDYDEANPGAFKDWENHVAVQVDATGSFPALDDARTDKPQTYRFYINREGGGYHFDFTPQAFYYEDVQVETGKDDLGNPIYDTKRVKTWGLKENDVFEITFDFVRANDLDLTVYSPVDALERVVDLARNSTQDVHSGTEYIQMDSPNDELYFISENFKLRQRTSIYNQPVLLSWKFIDESGAERKDVVRINETPDTNGWIKAVVTPEQTDLKGYLEVTADYTGDFFPIADGDADVNGNNIRQRVTKRVAVTIHGNGVPASFGEVKYTIGQSGEGSMPFPNTIFKMDKYKGGIQGYPEPQYPWMAVFTIEPGRENGFAREIIIDSSEPSALTATIQRGGTGVPTAYTFGSVFKNEGDKENPDPITFTIYAETPGTVTNLNFRFFIDGNNVLVEDPRPAKSLTVSVTDTSPDERAELSELTIRDKKNNRVDLEGFTFSPEVHEYAFNIDYEIENVILKPTVIQTAQKDIGVRVEYYNDLGQWIEAEDNIWDGKKSFQKAWYDNYLDRDDSTVEGKPSLKSAAWGGMQVNLVTPGQPVRVIYTVRAQNPNITSTYTIEMTRNLPSDDSTLKSLQLVDEEGVDRMTDPIQVGKLEYEIHIPYRIEMLQVLPELNHPGAVLDEDSYNPQLIRKDLFGSKNWLHFPIDKDNNTMDMTFEINIKAQNGMADDESHYKIHIIRDEPSDVSTAATLEVTDVNENTLTLNPPFAGVLEDEAAAYTVSVPYITDKVRIRVHPDDPYAKVRLEYWVNNTKREQTPATDALSKPIDIPVMSESAPYYEILVIVVAESGKETVYKVHVERAEPDTDAYLAGLDLKDLAGELQEFDDPFNPEVTSYTATVLYATDKVTVTPTASSPTATITVNGRKVASGEASSSIRLDYPGATDIEVKVTAQDEQTVMIYRIRVKRAEPSTDSRLRALEVSDVDRLKPVFTPRTLEYKANVNEGVTEVTVTATANDPFATLRIDGKNATSGQPSEPIVLMDIYQTVTVEVTAQDGKSVTVYTVELYNTNMVEKSSNADLSNLKVEYGAMTPKFASSVTAYDVAVKEDAYSVEIIPTPADPAAKVQVFAGTLEIGDEDGDFAQAIVDGANEFTVRVTAPDESKHKDYTVTVYRNEEDRMGVLTPITAEDIDFEGSGDIIVVDITKYTRVAADVFNTLKEKYPEKTIIFEGNDYSLQFDAADIKKIIPHTEVFDFSLSFNPPNRDKIMRQIRRYSGNDGIRTVLLHFGDSKELPAPARFTISLGRKYRNDQLYWHYWNDERSRIDYYGTVDTNSKGTFAVKLERLGDYIVADQRIVGSEDKSNMIALDGDLTKDTSLQKNNPNTGERGNGR